MQFIWYFVLWPDKLNAVGLGNFPNLIFLKAGILWILCLKLPQTCDFQVCFGILSALFLSPKGILSINTKVWMSFTGRLHFVLSDAYFHSFIKTFDKS